MHFYLRSPFQIAPRVPQEETAHSWQEIARKFNRGGPHRVQLMQIERFHPYQMDSLR